MDTPASVNISFLGGAISIGASCALVEYGESAIVVDCGIRFENNIALPDLSALHGKQISALEQYCLQVIIALRRRDLFLPSHYLL